MLLRTIVKGRKRDNEGSWRVGGRTKAIGMKLLATCLWEWNDTNIRRACKKLVRAILPENEAR